MNTYYANEKSKDLASACARGSYQRDLLEGDARWSGADLAGKARSYGARYHESRENLKKRLLASGLVYLEATIGRHRKRILLIGETRKDLLTLGEEIGARS
jgi:hypothetical protein